MNEYAIIATVRATAQAESEEDARQGFVDTILEGNFSESIEAVIDYGPLPEGNA